MFDRLLGMSMALTVIGITSLIGTAGLLAGFWGITCCMRHEPVQGIGAILAAIAGIALTLQLARHRNDLTDR